jgi:hypothetical protein
VLKTQFSNLIERVLSRGDAAGDDDHSGLLSLMSAVIVMARSFRPQ